MEIIIRVYPTGIEPFLEPLVRMERACQLFSCHDPNAEPGMVIIGYLTVLARCSLVVPPLFVQVVEHAQSTLLHMLTLMLHQYHGGLYPSIGTSKRMLWAIASLNYLHIEQACDHISNILEMCLDVAETCAAHPPSNDAYSGSCESRRMHALNVKDPIMTINFLHHFKTVLETNGEKLGHIHDVELQSKITCLLYGAGTK